MKRISLKAAYWFNQAHKIIFICLLAFSIQNGKAQDVLDWDTIPAGEEDNKWDHLKRTVTNFIWDQLDDNTFFNQWLYPNRARLGFRAQRRAVSYTHLTLPTKRIV